MTTIRLDAHKPEFHRAAPPQLPVRVATTANVTIATGLNAGDAIDGVTLAAGDRVLLKNQSTGAENGVYVAGTTPARAFDMLEGVAAYGAVIYVVAGTANGGHTFANTNTTVPTIDTDALTFTDYSPTSGGAPTTADYLVGTSQAGLSAEIVVGTTPGGELGNTWASPTVDTTHSGSAHADFIAKSVLTTQDDIIVRDGTGPARLAKGSDGQVLTVDPTTHHLVWATPTAGGFTNPMTTRGDLIIENSSPAPDRLPIGTSHKVLHTDGTDPSWQKIDETDFAFTDVTTANASTSAHGLLKKLPNDAALYMDGTGAYSTPSGGVTGAATPAVFGTGDDGDVTISVSATLSPQRDYYYNNLTVQTGVVVDCDANRIFVKGTLDLQGTAVLHCDGRNGGNGGNGTIAAGGGAGSAGSSGTTGQVGPAAVGLVGKAGGFNGNGVNGSNGGTTNMGITHSAGVAGGNSNTNTGGSGGTAGAMTRNAGEKPFAYPFCVTLRDGFSNAFTRSNMWGTAPSGGAGAGGSAAGGGGSGGSGASGNVLVVVARTVTGTGTLRANGGNGGNGGNGFNGTGGSGGGSGGNGGAGGMVTLIYGSKTGFSGAVTATGGNGGTGGTGQGSGSPKDGANGNTGPTGFVLQFQMG